MSLKADKKEKCLSWMNLPSGKKIAYFRKRIDGKDTWQSLGELALDDARDVVRKLRQAAALNLINEKLGLVSKRSTISTFEDLFKAYDAYTAGIDIGVKTVRDNKSAMRRIITCVKGGAFDVESARVSVFNVQMIRDFSARIVAERKEECVNLAEEEARKRIEAAQRTVKSTLQQARSLFARAALQSSAYSKLSLPDMDDVMEVKAGMSTLKTYEPPALDVVERIKQGAAKLKKENCALWLALNLEANGGLRRGSARVARWDWFSDQGIDAAGERVVYLNVNVAKGGRSKVRFDADVYDAMIAVKPKGAEYVIPGDTVEDRDAVCEALVEWLRDCGLDRRQPNHELRKLFGDRMYSTHGATEAQRGLGQSTPVLTSKVYAEAKSTKSVRVL